MALDRIYGDFQTAGVKMTTAAKSQINSQGTDAYAQAVVIADANGVLVPAGNSFTNVSTNTTTTAKTGTGVFAGFSVNTAGATSSLTVYDNTAGSGTKIGTFSTTAVGAQQIGAAFTTGLTFVTAGGTPADVTVYWR